ncbi:replication factor C small subunit [Pyrococcus furiosus DSM 3638]|uniref:Replication factor C small subunit n=3 Tax=Pyrococcus furiosus TaxID=2261 RepID=RFCS_PYRFU|nr:MULTISPECIES: replication factor C small subunit [Pyrococcus]Q8U4J3.1 RecName: Full=Replication factor C small subunit; Short=RFC small subunit; AltName: Full=Clamp loader small subunit; AltName: Full=PfuRFC small subunit; Contains: RecName: Full=Pfu RFC intein [Pyrococcus furiosus DSM 3638]AAL80217.1 replication factor C, small subunit [Pyrococcus furiosus DSM 3638]AFN04482.1 replication factor C small subunit [Pyrococcus furiosus COM1]MDK2869765.1 replication factor small subunit [Pyrococc
MSEEIREVKVLEKPWVEKYRPQRLDDIVGQEHIVKRLKHYVKTGSMPHLLFAGPPGVGKCLTGDTKVIANGQLFELGELVEKLSGGRFGPTPVKGLKVLGIDEDGKLREFEVQYVYKDRTDRLIKIKTQLGRELKVTPYHPLLVNRENGEIKWIKAEELKPGDKLAIPSFLPLITGENPLAEWLGYFMGSGYAYPSNSVITFTNEDPLIRQRFMELTEKLFPDAKIRERIHADGTPEVYVVSRKAWSLVNSISLTLIPREGWKGIRSFLRAYSDCNGRIESDAIVLSTDNNDMAQQIAYALASFGIIAKMDGEDVIISGSDNIERFLNEIGFSTQSKLKEAQKLIRKTNVRSDGLKINYELISYVKDRLRLNVNDKRNLSYRNAKELSWELMKEIYYRLEELERLKKVLSEPILIDWNEVAKKSDEVIEKAKIRAEKLLEYIKGERKPSFKEYIEIAKVLGINVERTIEAMKIFAKRYSSYAEIGRKLGTWNFNVKTILESDTVDNVEILEKIRKIELELIEEILSDGKLKEGIAYLIFLFQNELYWDEITEVKELRGDFIIYDLHVPGYHNFIAGNMPTVVHNTTAALALARELFGENWRHNFLELNASDERGINVIREKVKEFARTKPIGGASFKIIFLDEADALTQDAQQALRRTMEMFSSNVRFILSCNYSSKIIEPIQSRCAIFRFRPLRDEDIAKRLRYIAENEGLELTEEGLQAILYIAEGDMRRAINILQAAAALDKKITDENVFMVASRARPEDIREMMLLALKGNFLKAREKLREILLKQGLSGEDVLVQMHKEVFNLPIEEPKKVLLADKIGEYNFRLVEGANEIIQLEALLAQFTLIGKK